MKKTIITLLFALTTVIGYTQTNKSNDKPKDTIPKEKPISDSITIYYIALSEQQIKLLYDFLSRSDVGNLQLQDFYAILQRQTSSQKQAIKKQ